MFTRTTVKAETVTTRDGTQVEVALNEKTRTSTGRTVYEVTTKVPGTDFTGSYDAKTLAVGEAKFAESVAHFRTRY